MRKEKAGSVIPKSMFAGLTVAGALAAAAAFAPVAGAEPAPVPPPVPVPPAPGLPPAPPPGNPVPIFGTPMGPQGLAILTQRGLPAVEPLGTPALPELNRENLLGQNPVPMAPGGPPAAGPNLNPFNNAYMVPQNIEPAAPGEGTIVGVPPGQENADLGRIDYLRQIHELHKNGNLKGTLLGQVPKEQLGLPMPGTAPLPGTNLPPGLYPVVPAPEAIPAPAPPVPGPTG